jgi:hypothetical protein
MYKIISWSLWSLIALCFFIYPAGPARSGEPVFQERAWIFLDYNMPYLRKMIPLAAKEGITHVQLCHMIGMQLSDYLEPERNRDLRELIGLAHKHGVKTFVWTHELDNVPEKFIEGGMVIAAPCVLTSEEGQPVTVCASLDEHIYGLSPQGELQWKINTESPVTGNPVITTKKSELLVATADGKMIKVNARGDILWTSRLPGPVSGRPAIHLIDRQEIFSVACAASLYLLNTNGKSVKTLALNDNSQQISVAAKTTILDGKEVFIAGTNKGTLWAVDTDGVEKFRVHLGKQIRTAVEPVRIKNLSGLLVGVDNAILFVNEQGKEIKRFTAANDAMIGSGLLLNEKENEVLFTAMDRKLYVIDLDYFVSE